MKKLTILVAAVAIAILIAYSKAQAQFINLSTGTLNATTSQVMGGVDPFWKLAPGSPTTPNTYVVPPYGSYWQNPALPPISTSTHAQWINPGPQTALQTPGIYIFERAFPVAPNTVSFTYNFSIAYDDDLVGIELVPPSGAPVNLTPAVVRATSPTIYYLSNTLSSTVPVSAATWGVWKVRARIRYYDRLGGFMLSGTLTPKMPGCNCDLFNSRPEIHGPATVKCDSAARFYLTNCPDVSYTWTVTPAVPFTGQGTSAITLNPPFNASEYKIYVVIKCGDKQTTAGYVVKVEKKDCCDPAFKLSTEEVSATGYRITGIPTVPTLGCRHYWVLSQISNCTGTGTYGMSGWGLSYNAFGYALPQPNPAITPAGPNNNGYTYPGLAKGQCYVLTHYVLCCGEWKFSRKCGSQNNQAKMAQPAASEQSGTVEYKDLPKAVKDMYEKEK